MTRFISLALLFALAGCSAAADDDGVAGPRISPVHVDDEPEGEPVVEDADAGSDAAPKACGAAGKACCTGGDVCQDKKALCCEKSETASGTDWSCGDEPVPAGKCKVCCAACSDGFVKKTPLLTDADE